MTHWINYIILLILTGGLFLFVLADSRKLISIAFGLICVVSFSINVQFWSIGFSLSKLISGLIALLLLNFSPLIKEEIYFGESGAGRIFRAAMLAFWIILILFTYQKMSTVFLMSNDQLLAALFILICGLVQLGLSKDTFRVILGLLTLLLGFEIIYGTLEKSLLVNGLLAVVNLLIALVGSYLLNYRLQEEEE